MSSIMRSCIFLVAGIVCVGFSMWLGLNWLTSIGPENAIKNVTALKSSGVCIADDCGASKVTMAAIGQYGDSWGWINPLIGMVAAVLSAFTLVYQISFSFRQSIKDEERELENHIFQCVDMLSRLRDRCSFGALRAEFDLQSSSFFDQVRRGDFRSGSDFLELVLAKSRIRRLMGKNDPPELFEIDFASLRDDVRNDPSMLVAIYCYSVLYNKHRETLSPYFRLVYRASEFVAKSKVNIDAKWRVWGLFRANLSDQELFFIFYNCFYVHGEKLRIVAEKIALFDNLIPEYLCESKHAEYLLNSAFDSDVARSQFNFKRGLIAAVQAIIVSISQIRREVEKCINRI